MRRLLVIIIITIVTAVTMSSVYAQSGVICVDGIAGSDIRTGLGWGQAVLTINKGIQRAQEHNLHEVWVRATQYIECVVINQYYIELYGGFSGGEMSRDERDWANNTTIIVGKCNDLTAQYGPTVTIKQASFSVVDGFTITGGGGTMPGDARFGGGFYIVDSMSLKIWNNTVTDNKAKHGGGMYAQHSGMWVKNCAFDENIGYEEGGGIYFNATDFAPRIEESSFYLNQGGGRGGNLLMDNNSGGWVIYCEFKDGRAVNGANIACYNNSGPFIRENTINGGVGGKGAGIYNEASAPDILLNQITDNVATDDEAGGGIHCRSGSSPNIERNRISGNSSGETSKGGGIYCNASSPMIRNNIIDNNTTGYAGGGLAVENSSEVIVTSNTFAWNEADRNDLIYHGCGGAIYINDTAKVTARNNLFYEDMAYAGAEVYIKLGGVYDTDYNDYYNNRPEAVLYILYDENNDPQYHPFGAHDITADPKFLDSDYHIRWDSPVIDKGDNNATGITGVDYVDEDPRKIDGDKNGSIIIDMGADEYWPAVESLIDAKGAADNTPVHLWGMLVSGMYPGYFYAQKIITSGGSDTWVPQVCGIRINKSTYSASLGDVMEIYGRIKTNSNKERYIDASIATNLDSKPNLLRPLALSNRSLGGCRFPLTGSYYQSGVWSWNNGKKEPPWAPAKGLNNIGLLVRTSGKVTWVNRDPLHLEKEYFYIDDGSMRVDGSMHDVAPNHSVPNIGVRVVLGTPESIPMFIQIGSYVTVTGNSSCIVTDSDPGRLLRARNLGDIKLYVH